MTALPAMSASDTAPVLRPAQPTDAGTMGNILYRFQENTSWMPRLYAEVEMISFCGAMIDRGWVTVALQQGVVKGFMARDGSEICALYLAPGTCGQGLGHALLAAAKTAERYLWLRAFEVNLRARRFYQREGFTETMQGENAENPEGLPTVGFAWRLGQARSQAA